MSKESDIQAARRYLRQLAPHIADREGPEIIRKLLGVIERWIAEPPASPAESKPYRQYGEGVNAATLEFVQGVLSKVANGRAEDVDADDLIRLCDLALEQGGQK